MSSKQKSAGSVELTKIVIACASQRTQQQVEGLPYGLTTAQAIAFAIETADGGVIRGSHAIPVLAWNATGSEYTPNRGGLKAINLALANLRAILRAASADPAHYRVTCLVDRADVRDQVTGARSGNANLVAEVRKGIDQFGGFSIAYYAAPRSPLMTVATESALAVLAGEPRLTATADDVLDAAGYEAVKARLATGAQATSEAGSPPNPFVTLAASV